MTERSLLSEFALVGTQLIKLGAEILRPVPANDPCQARVELNLTPQPPDGPGAIPGGFVVAVRFNCVGLPPNGREDERLFVLEVMLNAAYRQELGTPLEFAEFQRHHTSLTRQLFPIMHLHASRLLGELGLGQIRLPQDLLAQTTGNTERARVH